MSFQADIVSLDGTIYSGSVDKITLPSIEGEITVLAKHMPIIVPLTVGEVRIVTPSKTLNLSIGKGVFEFSLGRARLLLEDVASADEISEERVLEAKKKAEELLAKGIKGEEKVQVMYTLRRSLVDLKLIRKRKKKI